LKNLRFSLVAAPFQSIVLLKRNFLFTTFCDPLVTAVNKREGFFI
jgi:hypothetical protein